MIQTQENNPTIKNKSAKCNVSVLHRANCILLGYYSFDVATIGVEGSGKWGGGVPLPSRLGDLGSVVSSPSGVRGGAPAENDFDVMMYFVAARRTLIATIFA